MVLKVAVLFLPLLLSSCNSLYSLGDGHTQHAGSVKILKGSIYVERKCGRAIYNSMKRVGAKTCYLGSTLQNGFLVRENQLYGQHAIICENTNLPMVGACEMRNDKVIFAGIFEGYYYPEVHKRCKRFVNNSEPNHKRMREYVVFDYNIAPENRGPDDIYTIEGAVKWDVYRKGSYSWDGDVMRERFRCVVQGRKLIEVKVFELGDLTESERSTLSFYNFL